MLDALGIAAQNLTSPVVLFFVLGFAAGLARSDLTIPEAVGKGLALYLMLAIGFKGGHAVSTAGLDATLVFAVISGIVLSAGLPFIAFAALRATTALDRPTAAAVAAHYGSISVVTFVAGSEYVRSLGFSYEGYLIAVMAIMETPAIAAGLWLARRGAGAARSPGGPSGLLHEVFLNGSVVLLVGAFAIGWITGDKGFATLSPFIEAPFRGALCLFLLDMGLLAAARLRGSRALSPGLIAFALYMPLIGAACGLAAGWASGLSSGGTALMTVLAASASYIVVPAAMRLALPEANPAVSLTASLSLTFPFNLSVGIPIYTALALLITG